MRRTFSMQAYTNHPRSPCLTACHFILRWVCADDKTLKAKNYIKFQPKMQQMSLQCVKISRLDYSNSTLWGLNLANELNHLQLIQNAAAHTVTSIKPWDHFTPVLWSLHWLPISKWIKYKIMCLTYRYVHETVLQYLQELVSPYNQPHCLRSFFLCRPSISGFGENKKKKHSSTRSFHNAVSTPYNRPLDAPHSNKHCIPLKSHLLSTP